MLRRIVAIVAAGFALLGLNGTASAGPHFVVALQGYDAVSYFEGGAPKKGSLENAVHWSGVTWLFEDQDNAERFRKDPSAYAPQFDGYCALAASLGYKAPADPLTGKVVAGKLYVNFNEEATRMWNQDIAGNIRKGEENWRRLNSF